MKTDEKIIARLDQLIELGSQVLATQQRPGPRFVADSSVNAQLAHQWATSVQSLLSRVFGAESDHYKNFSQFVSHKAIMYTPATRAQGVLKSAKDDYENGHLYEMRSLIEAEIFDDFLEQAVHLLENGYFQAAAVLAGSVLEDSLRKLCLEEAISISDKPKLDKMNADLTKNGTYSKLVQKKITWLADVRNKAAHGEWNQFERKDVDEMVLSVRKFLEDFLS